MNKLYSPKNVKNPNTTIRLVMTEDGKQVGLIGTVKDLLDEELLIECDALPNMAALIRPNGTATFYYDLASLRAIVEKMEC